MNTANQAQPEAQGISDTLLYIIIAGAACVVLLIIATIIVCVKRRRDDDSQDVFDVGLTIQSPPTGNVYEFLDSVEERQVHDGDQYVNLPSQPDPLAASYESAPRHGSDYVVLPS